MDKNVKIYELNDRIRELKYNLTVTDFMAIKYCEGEITSAEYAEMREKRRKWRSEINALETEIKALKG